MTVKLRYFYSIRFICDYFDKIGLNTKILCYLYHIETGHRFKGIKMDTVTFAYSVYASNSILMGKMACMVSKTSSFEKAFNAYIDLINDNSVHTVIMYDENAISESNPLGVRFSKGL